MTRYRSELTSLRARITVIERELDELDQREMLGRYARTRFESAMYWLGRQLGRFIHWLRRRRRPETALAEARARVTRLERRLEQRRSGR